MCLGIVSVRHLNHSFEELGQVNDAEGNLLQFVSHVAALILLGQETTFAPVLSVVRNGVKVFVQFKKNAYHRGWNVLIVLERALFEDRQQVTESLLSGRCQLLASHFVGKVR